MSQDTFTPVPQPTATVALTRVQSALAEFARLRLVMEKALPLVDACSDALNYIDPKTLREAGLDQAAVDLTRARITFSKLLAVLNQDSDILDEKKR